MKKLVLTLAAVSLSLPVHAQSSTLYSNSTSVAIGTTSPTTGAALDLSYNTNSLLLPVGTTGQRPTGVNGMMRYNSSLGAIESYTSGAWGTVAGGSGGWVTLATATASSSASISFTSIPSGYDQYVILLTNVLPATDATNFYITVSEDNGSTYKSANYAYQQFGFNTSSGGAAGSSSDSQLVLNKTTDGISSTQPGLSGQLNCVSFGSSTVNKQCFGNINWWRSGANGYETLVFGGAYTGDTGAINAVKFSFSSGNIASGSFALYGITN